jgi:hypothetical protein
VTSIGEQATDFEYRPFSQELQLCQRYYEKSYDLATLAGTPSTQNGAISSMASGTSALSDTTFVVRKRTVPTVVIYGNISGASGVLGTNLGSNVDVAPTQMVIGERGIAVHCSGTVSSNVTTGYHFTADAEL